MLAKKAKKKYCTGLQELHIRDENNQLSKPDLNFVKEEGRGMCSHLDRQIIHLLPSLMPLIY